MQRVRQRCMIGCVVAGVLLGGSPAWPAAELVVYGFEGSLEGWGVPEWAATSPDYVARQLVASRGYASEGQYALELLAAFPGGRWAGAYVEREAEVTDWTPFGRLSVDVYLPAGAPDGLRARLILTVGTDWRWTEMRRAVPLTPGTWTTLTAHLVPGDRDWKVSSDDRFRADVRKLGIRIESDGAAPYRGSVFIDGVRVAD